MFASGSAWEDKIFFLWGILDTRHPLLASHAWRYHDIIRTTWSLEDARVVYPSGHQLRTLRTTRNCVFFLFSLPFSLSFPFASFCQKQTSALVSLDKNMDRQNRNLPRFTLQRQAACMLAPLCLHVLTQMCERSGNGEGGITATSRNAHTFAATLKRNHHVQSFTMTLLFMLARVFLFRSAWAGSSSKRTHSQISRMCWMHS